MTMTDTEHKIKTIVVDDEFPARKLLAGYISKVSSLELVATCADAMEAMAVMQSEEVELIFTDIQMPELTGIDFVRSLASKPMVVFTTAYSQYAIESYELEAVYYLLKPVSFPNFMKAVNKAVDYFNLKRQAVAAGTNGVAARQKEENNYLMVKADYKLYKINFSDLIYVEGQSEYVTFHTTEKKITAYYSLKKLEEELPQSLFARIHKSYIVSIGRIDAIEGNMVVMGKEKIPIGKNYKDAFMAILCRDGNGNSL